MAKDDFLNRCRGCLREFVHGATKPSLPALVGALAVAVFLFLLCVTLITPDLLATKGYRYVLVNPGDEYACLTSEVLRVGRFPSCDLTVAVIGSSTTREAISDADHLEQLLLEKTKRSVTVYVLATGGLNHWEAVCVLDCIRDRFRGLVVLEVSPVKLSLERDHLRGFAEKPRLALDSSAFDEEVRLAGLEVPRRVNNYFLDHYQFFVARPGALLNLVNGPVQPKFHFAEHWRPPTEQEWERAVRHLASWQKTYRDNRDANLGVYARLIRRLRERDGNDIVLLEAVCNPRASAVILSTPEAKQLHEEYKADITRFARENNVAYWDLSAAAQLVPEDFVDHHHIRSPEVRRRYTEALAARLGDRLIKSELMKESQR